MEAHIFFFLSCNLEDNLLNYNMAGNKDKYGFRTIQDDVIAEIYTVRHMSPLPKGVTEI